MRHGRFITTALVATAAMAIGPAWASAAPSHSWTTPPRTSRRDAGDRTLRRSTRRAQSGLKHGTMSEHFDGRRPAREL